MTCIRSDSSRFGLCVSLVGLCVAVPLGAAAAPAAPHPFVETSAAERVDVAVPSARTAAAPLRIAASTDEGGNPNDQAAQVSESRSDDLDVLVLVVREHAQPGTTVGKLSESASSSELVRRYSIAGGNTNEAFAIDPATGQITVNRSDAVDFESNSRFELLIQSTSKKTGGDALRSQFAEHLQQTGVDRSTVERLMSEEQTQTVVISVVNVNESPQIDGATFRIGENSPPGTLVGTLTCTDVDAADTARYSIVDGNGHHAFRINPQSGQLTVDQAAVLDFETQPDFELTIEVTDSGGLRDTARVGIELEDVDEPAPTPTTIGPEPDPFASDQPVIEHEDLPPLTPETGDRNAISGTGDADNTAAATPVKSQDKVPPTEAPQRSWLAIFFCVLGLGALAGNAVWFCYLARNAVQLHRRRIRLDEDCEHHQQQRRVLQSERDQFAAEQQRVKKLQNALARSEVEFQHRKRELETALEDLAKQRQELQSDHETLQAECARVRQLQASLEAQSGHVGEEADVPAMDRLELDLDADNPDGSQRSPLTVQAAQRTSKQGGGRDGDQLSELRSTLTEMFNMSPTEDEPESQLESAQSLIEQAIDYDTESGTESSEPAPAGAVEAPCDTVSEYMEQFMKRYSLDWRGSEKPPSGQPQVNRNASAPVAAAPTAASETVPEIAPPERSEEEPETGPAPRNRPDAEAERVDLMSLRAVANQAARAAVAAHSRKQVRNSTLFKGIGVVACFATAAVLYVGQFVASNAPVWGAITVGCVMSLELLYSMRSVHSGSQQDELD